MGQSCKRNSSDKEKVKTRGCCKRLHLNELMNCCGTSRHWSDLILDVLVSSCYLFIHGLATGGWEVTDMVQRITSYTPDVDHDEKQGWIHVIMITKQIWLFRIGNGVGGCSVFWSH